MCVHTIHPAVKLVVQWVVQPDALGMQTSSWLYNRLYRVNTTLVAAEAGNVMRACGLGEV